MLPDAIGLIGVAAILTAYALLQTERLRASDPRYSAANALGAAAILFSLAYDFNLSAVVIEGSWLVISIYGLARTRRARRQES